jgi:hypothetical protein
MQGATDGFERFNLQAGILGILAKCEGSIAVIVEGSLVNPVEKRHTDDCFATRDQDSRDLPPNPPRFEEMLDHVSAENCVCGIVWERNPLVQVAKNIDMITVVKTGTPVDPYALRHKIAVHSEIGCLPATNIGKNTGCVSPNLPPVSLHDQICNKP